MAPGLHAFAPAATEGLPRGCAVRQPVRGARGHAVPAGRSPPARLPGQEGHLGATRRVAGHRGERARRPLLFAPPARLHARRAHRARRRDRATTRSSRARPARRLDRRAGRRHATACGGATTTPCSATRSGPHSWKRSCTRPRSCCWRARRGRRRASRRGAGRARRRRGWPSSACAPATSPRSRIQDRVFLGGPYVDPDYAARREGAFIVAVTAARPAAPASAPRWAPGRGPTAGFDLALTELARRRAARVPRRGRQRRGRRVLAAVPHRAGRRSRTIARPRAPSRARRRAAWAARWRPTAQGAALRATSSTRAGTRWPSAA